MTTQQEKKPLFHSGQEKSTNQYHAVNEAVIQDVEQHPHQHIHKLVHLITPSKQGKLGISALSVLIFYTVCGGPFGVEDIVRAGGPAFAILGFLLIFAWAIPEALITTELSIAFPESSGSVAWVEYAFGEFWAFQKGYLSWLSGIADNALYPILFLDCFLQLSADENGIDLLSEDVNGKMRLLILFCITVLLTYLNYRGLEVIGQVSLIICLLSLTPFIVFCIIGLPKVSPSKWFTMPTGGIKGVDWSLLLNTFFWNINFWESSASFSGDVENVEKTYPSSMMIAVALVFFSLLLPVLVGIGASDEPYTAWTDGYFVHLGRTIVGPWLSYWMIFAAMITNIAMFEAEMSSDSYQLAGMAERGILPSVLNTRSQYGTPIYGIILSAIGIAALCFLDFSEVIDILNLLYCYGQLIEFAAYFYIRYRQLHPSHSYIELTRIATVITNDEGETTTQITTEEKHIKFYYSIKFMMAMFLLPIGLIFVILCLSPLRSLLISFGCALFGLVSYYLLQYMKQHQWCQFYS